MIPDDGRWSSAGVRRTIRVGDVTATYLPDGHVELHPERWFSLPPGTGPYEQMPQVLTADRHLIASVGALLLEGPGWRILVDAGLGPTTVPAHLTHRSIGSMVGGGLARFADTIASVDAVVMTHAHDDHVGWALRGWPGFHGVADVPHLVGHGEDAPGAWVRVRDGQAIAPGVVVAATPGHTRGHISLVVDGGGPRLVVVGDVVHSPVQVTHAHLSACFDLDPRLSRRSRARVLGELAPGTVAAATHFADVPFGEVRDGRWSPLT